MIWINASSGPADRRHARTAGVNHDSFRKVVAFWAWRWTRLRTGEIKTGSEAVNSARVRKPRGAAKDSQARLGRPPVQVDRHGDHSASTTWRHWLRWDRGYAPVPGGSGPRQPPLLRFFFIEICTGSTSSPTRGSSPASAVPHHTVGRACAATPARRCGWTCSSMIGRAARGRPDAARKLDRAVPRSWALRLKAWFMMRRPARRGRQRHGGPRGLHHHRHPRATACVRRSDY